MSVHVIKMPDLGEGIAEVELVNWHVKPGDQIEEDQVLVDVMTDKATVEIPSPVAGTVASLGGEVGEVLAVGADLIRIDTAAAVSPPAASESPPVAPDAAAAAGGTIGPSVASASAAAPAPAPAPAPVQTKPTAPSAAKTPAPSPAATAAPAERRPAPSAAPAAGAAGAAARKVIASPALRARAWELGIDLAAIEPSGTAGRLMQADLDAALARGAGAGAGNRAPSPAPAAAAGRAAAPSRGPAGAGATDQVRVIGLRRRIAQKMQDSKRRIPHYAYVEEVDVTELEVLRTRLNERFGKTRGKLTLLPLLIRALVRAVPEFPEVNALFDDEAGVLTRHGSVHVGIATQTDAGLMVPVLRDAQEGDLWHHAAEIVRLAEAARSGKAVRDELTGSTITVTSLGKLGGIATTPVINHPEVAIVGVNKMVERPMVRNGTIAIRQMMNLSSSFDHRVVDGAQAAAFIQRIREALEHPALLFVE